MTLDKREEVLALLRGEEDAVMAKITSFGVEIFGKTISTEDFIRSLTETTSSDIDVPESGNLPEYKTQSKVLPSNILKYNGDTKNTTISLYFPETYVDVTLSLPSGHVRKRIVVPNTIVTATYTKDSGSENDWTQHGSVKYFCSNRTLADLKKTRFIYEANPSAGVWILAMPNIFSEGRMCVGRDNEHLLPKSIKDGDFSRIGYNYHFLLEAPFNSDLSIPNTKRKYSAEKWLDLLESQAERGLRFPYEELTE